MATIETKVEDLLKKYDLPKEAAWKHAQSGKWIMKHSALEVIGSAIGIRFDMPTIVQLDLLRKVACIVVLGTVGDRKEWSFGEATADNCKMNYYASMAEKRGKDRVILKFLNLHGEVYSEDEADNFKQKKITAKVKKERWQEIMKEMDNVKNLDDLGFLWTSLKEELAMLKYESEEAFLHLEARKNELKKLFSNIDVR